MSNFDEVRIFMETYNQEIKQKPSFPDDKIIQLRINLIIEELNELKVAIKNKNLMAVIEVT